MTYLNVEIKDYIVAAAIKQAGVLEKEAALVERRAVWAEAVRVDALGGKEAAAKIERLSKRFEKMLTEVPDSIRTKSPLQTHYSMSLNVGGLRTEAPFNGRDTNPARPLVSKISPHSHTLKAGTPLANEFAEIEKEAEKLADLRATISGNVRAALNRVRTVKKLLEEWPEASALLPDTMGAAKTNLPALPRKDLNKLVGLP